MTKRLPPFGANLVNLPIDLKDVFVATDWILAIGRRRVVIPRDLPIDSLNLGILAGRSVVLVHRAAEEEARMVDLVKAILAARPARLVALDVDALAVSFLRTRGAGRLAA